MTTWQAYTRYGHYVTVVKMADTETVNIGWIQSRDQKHSKTQKRLLQELGKIIDMFWLTANLEAQVWL